ncbi:PspC domain-containing protein [Arundinibacter roseus]|uniref:PspC domain-containing protein n=1 Tax=Arundinibacter roseus TaxID=2070510 RepID=A0A4V2XAK6_9BACT|nr:PspC domain-containing protein [Arundinibacter roseus]TDB68055.1 PspC domain-containing protein [Arundinibacter roseus]
MEKKLTRIPEDAVLGGVASGMAHYFGIDKTIIRILWVVALLLPVPPSFFWTTVAYIIFWAVLPESHPSTTYMPGEDPSTTPPSRSYFSDAKTNPDRTVKILGIALLAVGAFLLLDELPYWYRFREYVWPVALIGAGAYLLLRQRDKEQYTQSSGTDFTSPPPTPPVDPMPPVDPDPVPYRPFDSNEPGMPIDPDKDLPSGTDGDSPQIK